MSNTIQLTDEQMAALQRGEDVVLKAPKKAKWEPKGGRITIIGCGELIVNSTIATNYATFGSSYTTHEQAEKARDAMRVHNRLLAYVAEFDSGWDGVTGRSEVGKTLTSGEWFVNEAYESYFPGVVYMSRQCAEGLVVKLNSGEVVL